MPSTSKATNPSRRVSSSLAKVSTPPTSARTSKAAKSSKIVALKLPSKLLLRFDSNSPGQEPSPKPPPKQIPDVTSTSSPLEEEDSKPVDVKGEVISPPTATPGSETPQPPTKDIKGKPTTKASSPKTGSKRALGAGVDGPKPRARPGPKKKAKLEETNGETVAPSGRGGPGASSAPAHKLGPKANQGAINAGLRALDRSGKPCRKWEKRGIRIKTFTGVTLELPSWRGGAKNITSRDTTDNASSSTPNSFTKDNVSSSQVGSENSSATPHVGIKPELTAGLQTVAVS
ncbi:MAG: hypothetical protein Q9212_006184 [Teloschistes hypoglaucus]